MEYTQVMIQKKTQLSNNHSIFSAELQVIYRCSSYFIDNSIKNGIIVSDSLAAIKSLESKYSKNALVIKIRENLQKIPQTILFWVPDHVQIFGNEEADKLAKKSLKDTSAISTKVIPTGLKIKSKIFVKNLGK